MKTSTLKIIAALVLVIGLTSSLYAQGTAFTYQGRLNSGANPASGVFDLTFTLYNTNNTGTIIVGPVTNSATAVTNGLFTTTIDFGPGVFTGTNNWLAIGVRTNGAATFTPLTPRQQLTPTPYAIYSTAAGSALTATTAGSASSATSATTATTATIAITATNLVGNVSDAQLSANIARLNGTNAFTGTNTFAGITSATNAGNIFNGTFNGSLTGNGAGVTNIPLAGLQAVPLTNAQSGVTLNGLTIVSNLSVTTTNFVNSLVVSNPPALNGSAITGLNASQLTSGTVPLTQLSGITSTQLTALAWQLATNLNGGNAALASNVVAGIAITNAFITNAIFAGNGAGLTNLNAAQLSGNITLAQLPPGVLTNNSSSVTLNGTFSGSGAGLTGLTATATNLPAGILTNNASNVTLNGLTTLTNAAINYSYKSFFTNYTTTINDVVLVCNGTNQVVTLLDATNFPPTTMLTIWSDNPNGSVTVTNATGSEMITVPGLGQSLAIYLGPANSPSNSVTLMVHGGHW